MWTRRSADDGELEEANGDSADIQKVVNALSEDQKTALRGKFAEAIEKACKADSEAVHKARADDVPSARVPKRLLSVVPTA